MLIKNVAVSLPSRIVTNDEVADMIRFHSTGYDGDIDRGIRTIKTLLDRSGLVNRRWCDSHESPIDHVAMATRKALS
jgi:3-oxoacyl-[acyl-carrier-protein] synthase III